MVKEFLFGWAAILILFLTYRAWAGGLFDSGLENHFIPFGKANADDSVFLPELQRDLSAPTVD